MLAAIPSPTGSEAACGAAVTAQLEALGLTVEADGAGSRVDGDCDNLYCRIPATVPGEPLFLCAHLDTVPPTRPLEPVVVDGIVRNSTPSIIGADNKAAVAVVLHVARTLDRESCHMPASSSSSPSEKNKVFAAPAPSTSSSSARRPGSCSITPARSAATWRLRHTLHRLHDTAWPGLPYRHLPGAGNRCDNDPGARRSPVPEGTPTVSINVAQIAGGTALNVIPGSAELALDVRSLEHREGLIVIEWIEQALRQVAEEAGCTLEIQVDNPYLAYRVPADSGAVALAQAACGSLGLAFRPIHTRGGSDANVFRVRRPRLHQSRPRCDRLPRPGRAGGHLRPRLDGAGRTRDREERLRRHRSVRVGAIRLAARKRVQPSAVWSAGRGTSSAGPRCSRSQASLRAMWIRVAARARSAFPAAIAS